MPTLSTTPAYPVSGARIKVSFSATSGGNYVKLYVRDAPIGSELKLQLTREQATRLQLFAGPIADSYEFQVDKAGSYVFEIEEYTKGASTYGGGYQRAPDANPSETYITNGTAYIRVGQRLLQRVGYGSDTATLVLHVFNDTIRETTFKDQGEASPALIEHRSDAIKTASIATVVLSTINTLKGVTASTALGTLSTQINDLIDNCNAHFANAAVHNATDAVNLIAATYKSPTTAEALKRTLTELASKLDRHMRNDTGPTASAAGGTGTGTYHVVGGANVADWTNLPLQTSVGSLEESIAVFADSWRAYDAHRQSTTVHSSADNTNDPASLAPLPALHYRISSELRSLSPTAPATMNSGAVQLIHSAGFREG